MPAKPSRAKSVISGADEVDAFLAASDYPRKAEIVALGEIILGADPSIAQGIKWNSPSYRTTDWFATSNLRVKEGVQIILHFGARKRDNFAPRAQIADPEGLVKWIADDRGTATFRDMADIQAKRSAFAALIREWIVHVDGSGRIAGLP